MKNLLYLFLIGIFFSCGDDEEDVIDYVSGLCHIQDTVGLKVLGDGICWNPNDTCKSLCGVKNGKLWIGVYDSDSGDEQFTWTSSNDYDLTRTRDIGYGEIATFNINEMVIFMYAQDNKNFKILLRGRSSDIIIFDLLFVHNNKEVLYSDVEYSDIQPWNDNNLLAFVSRNKCSLFSESGEKIYDVETNFDIWNCRFFPSDGSKNLFSVEGNLYIPLNNNEFVKIYNVSSYYGGTVYYVYKGDLQHSSYIWPEQQIFKTEYNAKCNYNVSINGNKLTITIHTVLYSGEKSTNVFEVDIDTGDVTKL